MLKLSWHKKKQLAGYLFMIPAVIFLLYATVVPFVWNFGLSFVKWDGFGAPKFVGLKNFTKVFQDKDLLKSLWNSIYYAITTTVGGVLVGLLMAVLVIRLAGKEGSIFRLILFSPSMLPVSVAGLMFTFFFNSEMGLLNQFLGLIGLESLQHVWLQDKETAMACIIFVAIWKRAGQMMMLIFAAIQTIPNDLFEAARLDGADHMKQLWYIILPLVRPMILLATINSLGSQYKSYDLIFTMTRGGPGNLTTTVPIEMTKIAFTYGRFGQSAAMGVIFTVVVVGSILVAQKLLKGEEYEF